MVGSAGLEGRFHGIREIAIHLNESIVYPQQKLARKVPRCLKNLEKLAGL
jgi:hypothetical protein